MSVKKNGMTRIEVLVFLVKDAALTEHEAEDLVGKADALPGKWRPFQHVRLRKDGEFFTAEVG